jgi:NADPH:quinone reductase-like Zn-dependent oxidoreductase
VAPLADDRLLGHLGRARDLADRHLLVALLGEETAGARLLQVTKSRFSHDKRAEHMMRAARFSRFGGPEVLEIVNLPEPHPGPGQVRIAVRAAGVNPSDWKKRKGLMDQDLPQTLGYEAAGVVDELGDGITDVTVGDPVVGVCAEAAAQAELAVLSAYAPIPPSLDFPAAAALPATIETAVRALDQLGVARGSTLLINGASGSVGSAAVQFAVARGARVIGTAGAANHDYLRSLGAEPVRYGEGLTGRVRALAPTGVDLALDVAEIAEAHRVSEQGIGRGRLVLLIG